TGGEVGLTLARLPARANLSGSMNLLASRPCSADMSVGCGVVLPIGLRSLKTTVPPNVGRVSVYVGAANAGAASHSAVTAPSAAPGSFPLLMARPFPPLGRARRPAGRRERLYGVWTLL